MATRGFVPVMYAALDEPGRYPSVPVGVPVHWKALRQQVGTEVIFFGLFELLTMFKKEYVKKGVFFFFGFSFLVQGKGAY